jgi:hypothetical protein
MFTPLTAVFIAKLLHKASNFQALVIRFLPFDVVIDPFKVPWVLISNVILL